MTKRIEAVLCALAGGALGLCASAAEISTEKICGLFIDGEEPLFAVKAAVGSTWKVTDWRGRTVEEGPVTETVKPSAPVATAAHSSRHKTRIVCKVFRIMVSVSECERIGP